MTLPESLVEIGDEAFAGCSALNAMSVPEGVGTVGENAFSECGEALLIVTGAGSEAVLNYARANQVDYRAGTRYRALLIGQVYEDSPVSRLVGPANDVEALRKRLLQIGWEADVQKELTADGIRAAIGNAFGDATENDVSLFYYSGHGWEDGSLMGTDAEGIAPGSLRSALDGIPGRKVIIVDACYSGKLIEEEQVVQRGMALGGAAEDAGPAEEPETMSDTGFAKEPETAEDDGPGDESALAEAFVSSFQAAFRPRLRGALNANDYFVITAARANETSMEDYISSGGCRKCMGVFTYYLCLGLGYDGVSGQQTGMNADSNGDGAVSVQEAYAYAAANALTINRDQHAAVWPDGCRWFAPFRD